MPTAFANGIDVYFEREGSGRPLRRHRRWVSGAAVGVNFGGVVAQQPSGPAAIPDGFDFLTAVSMERENHG